MAGKYYCTHPAERTWRPGESPPLLLAADTCAHPECAPPVPVLSCDLCGREVRDDDDAYRYQVVKPGGAIEPYSAQHAECADRANNSLGQRVRISCDGTDFSRAHVFIIQPDGTEIPISQVVASCTIRIADNQLNQAVVTFDGVELEIVARSTNPVYVQA